MAAHGSQHDSAHASCCLPLLASPRHRALHIVVYTQNRMLRKPSHGQSSAVGVFLLLFAVEISMPCAYLIHVASATEGVMDLMLIKSTVAMPSRGTAV